MFNTLRKAYHSFFTVFGFLFGILFIAVGIYTSMVISPQQKKLEKSCTETIDGIVTHREVRQSDDDVTYHATVEFELDGKVFTDSGQCSSSVREGDKIRVKYDPDDHSVYYVPEFSTSSDWIKWFGLIFIAFGVVFIFVNIRFMRRPSYGIQKYRISKGL